MPFDLAANRYLRGLSTSADIESLRSRIADNPEGVLLTIADLLDDKNDIAATRKAAALTLPTQERSGLLSQSVDINRRAADAAASSAKFGSAYTAASSRQVQRGDKQSSLIGSAANNTSTRKTIKNLLRT